MSATSPQEALSRENEIRSHARARGGDRALTHTRTVSQDHATDHATAAGMVIGSIQRTRDVVDKYLAAFPSSRVAHYAAALEALANAVNVSVMKDAEREQRRTENARDRRLRTWEPHQIRAAEKMGFDDPAEWRTYIDEREAAGADGFPSPEEWRAKR